MERKKIVEIYAEDDEDNDKVYFDVERIEDSMVANAVMKMMLNTFKEYKGTLEDVKYDGEV